MNKLQNRLFIGAVTLGSWLGLSSLVQADPLPSQYLFGTLMTTTTHASEEYAAGIRTAHDDLYWRDMQDQEGDAGWDTNNFNFKKNEITSLMNAGLKVSLGFGFQYPPSWIFAYPDSRYVNQNGRTPKKSDGSDVNAVNFTFNSVMRLKAENYMNRFFTAWTNSAPGRNINDFWAIRVGSGAFVEVFYPSEDDGQGQTNSYWAWGGNTTGSSTDRPSAIPTRPFPNWKPGDTLEYSGGPAMNQAKVKQWFDWYMAAQMDTVNWQINYLRNKGYTGYIQVLMPGVGTRPADYNTATSNYLNGAGDSNHTLGRAAVWNKVIDGITNKNKVVISITSLADGSGSNDWTQPGDSSLVIGTNDSQFQTWSAARWISYNANRYSLPKNGETRGGSGAQQTTVLDAAIAQMKGCQMQGMQWAHSGDLYTNTSPNVTLDEYSKRIEECNGATYEAEGLSIVSSSGDGSSLVSDASMSGGQGTAYNSNAVNDYVVFKINVPHARTYKVMVRVKQFSSRGQCLLATADTTARPFTNASPSNTLDLYASGTGNYVELDAGNVTFTTSGDKVFRFKVTGKNASSTGYSLVFDDIRLIGL